MNQLTIKKKYVVVAEKDYELLQRKAVLKIKEDDLLTLSQARECSQMLIRKWTKSK